MARKDEAADLLTKGKCPSEIAVVMGITIGSVEHYLYTKVGEGAIRRSDILFSINATFRSVIEDVIRNTGKTDCYSVFSAARRQGCQLNYKDLEIYMKLRDARIPLGDMYEFIYQIETTLHEMIKRTLVNQYGEGEKGWWRKGIPVDIRRDCSKLWQEDAEPAAEPFCYTTIVHLKRIIDDQWATFSQVLPGTLPKEKKKLLSNLNKLNGIRNYVMHPVKGMPITEEDFAFVRAFNKVMKSDNWVAGPGHS
jgi:predicted transcriptional regulator